MNPWMVHESWAIKSPRSAVRTVYSRSSQSCERGANLNFGPCVFIDFGKNGILIHSINFYNFYGAHTDRIFRASSHVMEFNKFIVPRSWMEPFRSDWIPSILFEPKIFHFRNLFQCKSFKKIKNSINLAEFIILTESKVFNPIKTVPKYILI